MALWRRLAPAVAKTSPATYSCFAGASRSKARLAPPERREDSAAVICCRPPALVIQVAYDLGPLAGAHQSFVLAGSAVRPLVF